jgi:fructokinase
MISRVGDDGAGREIFEAMANWGMDTEGIQVDLHHPTGSVEVTLKGGEPEFEILPDRAWDHVEARKIPTVTDPRLLYHGTLAARAPVSRATLDSLVATSCPRFVDANLRTHADAASLLEDACWIKLNEDELGEVMGRDRSLDEAAGALAGRCGAEMVFVTRGRLGAHAVRSSGEVREIVPPPGLPIVDTVGAGDGFAAVAIYGLLAGWSLGTLLERAQAFAGAIVGVRGATVGDRGFYERHLDEWSAS